MVVTRKRRTTSQVFVSAGPAFAMTSDEHRNLPPAAERRNTGVDTICPVLFGLAEDERRQAAVPPVDSTYAGPENGDWVDPP